MMDDREHSRERWLKQEYFRIEQTGFGTGSQGHAIRRRYSDQLAKILTADRHGHRHREIWRALKDAGLVGEQARTALLVDRLLTVGITAAAGDGIGVDKDGIKNFRDQAIWLGQHLGLKRRDVTWSSRVGAWAIDMLNDLPVFALDEDFVLTLPLTPELDEFLNVVVEQGIRNNAFVFPSAEPPELWTQVSKGGLPPNAWARISLISARHPRSESAVRKAIADGKMQPVLDAVNYLAGTAFTINKPVLTFMRRREDPKIQKLSAEADALARQDEPRKLKWPERQKLANLKSELSVWELDIMAAKVLTSRDRFFVPLQIDFRGRINPLPFFNFTRSDCIRALFLFNRGEKIGEEGLFYLKAHVAACADGNKWSTVERPGNLDRAGRVAWTNDNLEVLRKVGNAVLRGEDPAQWEWVLVGDNKTIGDPYQFVAACVELAQALEVGPSFVTRLPLTFDATCSGLQHMCMMMRAEEGRLVNLTKPESGGDHVTLHTLDGDTIDAVVEPDGPYDFYSLVGATVWRKRPDLRNFFKDGNPFDRKIIKRPGMTYGYGSRPGGWQKPKRGRGRPKPKGMTEQIVEVLNERGMSATGAHKLAKAAYDVIEEMMPAAKTLRNFLEKIARLHTKCNKPMRWDNSLGLPVLNAYYGETKPQTFSVTINGKRRRTNLITGDTDDIDPQANTSVTANFVHSSDACHLHMVANAASKEAIPLVTIHDCFGATAPHARRLNEILREQFNELHNHDWLAQVLLSAKCDLPKSVHAKLPELPKRGTLDDAGVLQSLFFVK